MHVRPLKKSVEQQKLRTLSLHSAEYKQFQHKQRELRGRWQNVQEKTIATYQTLLEKANNDTEEDYLVSKYHEVIARIECNFMECERFEFQQTQKNIKHVIPESIEDVLNEYTRFSEQCIDSCIRQYIKESKHIIDCAHVSSNRDIV